MEARGCSSDHTQIYPWVGKPGYNLTTDMADEAIEHIKGLNVAAPDQPFLVYYAPGGSHAPHQPTPEWIKKISDMHLFDKGWNDLREQILANQKRLGVMQRVPSLHPGRMDNPNTTVPSSRNGTHSLPMKRSSSFVRRCRRLRSIHRP